jgi:hypothetical protein
MRILAPEIVGLIFSEFEGQADPSSWVWGCLHEHVAQASVSLLSIAWLGSVTLAGLLVKYMLSV